MSNATRYSAYQSAWYNAAFNPNLNPRSVKLDDRDMAGLLTMTSKLSDQFWYYDLNGQRKGDWSEFFETDLTAILAIISKTDKQEEYRLILSSLNTDKGCIASRQSDFLFNAFQLFFNTVIQVDEWYTALQFQHEAHQFFEYLKDLIWHKLSLPFNKVYDLFYELVCVGGLSAMDERIAEAVLTGLKGISEIWNFSAIRDLPATDGAKTESLKQALKVFYVQYRQLVNEAEQHFLHTVQMGNVQPHIALLLAFFKLYKHQQQTLNGQVARHLDFYYKRLLNFQKQPARPDSTFLLFRLNENEQGFELPKGTLLAAGTDANGNDIHFATQKTQRLTSAILQEYKTKTDKGWVDITNFSSPQLNELTRQYSFFSMANPPVVQKKKTAPPKQIGIAITSPDLWLQGGDRKIYLNLTLALNINNGKKGADQVHNHLMNEVANWKEAIPLAITTAEGWFKFEGKLLPEKATSETNIELPLNINADLVVAAPAVASYSSEIHGPGFKTSYPVLKVLFNPLQSNSEYDITSCEISGSIKGLKVLQLNTPDGEIVIGANGLAPFGYATAQGAEFVIGTNEPFIKNLDCITLSFNWKNRLSAQSFVSYYTDYIEYLWENGILDLKSTFKEYKKLTFSKIIEDLKKSENLIKPLAPDNPVKIFLESQYKVGTSVLSNGIWHEADATQSMLFQAQKNASTYKLNFPKNVFPAEIQDYEHLPPFSDEVKNGFIKLQLVQPQDAFAVKLYPDVLNWVTMQNTVNAAKQVEKSKKLWYKIKTWFCKILKKSNCNSFTFRSLPVTPYVPLIDSISVNYCFQPTICGAHQAKVYRIFENQAPILSDSKANDLTNDTTVSTAGSVLQNGVYLGFNELKANSYLNLYLAIKPNEKALRAKAERIEVFTQAGWKALTILNDGTGGFKHTGILELMIDGGVPALNVPDLNPELHWIRFVFTCGINPQIDLLMIGTNCAKATRVLKAGELENPDLIKAGTITDFIKPVPQISQVSQPFQSAGYQAKEDETQFRQRVSQRLRYKGRAGSLLACQTLILEQFKEVFQVNVLVTPGSRKVNFYLVPWVYDRKSPDLYSPVASQTLLSLANSFITKCMASDLEINTLSAEPEPINVAIEITFRKENDQSEGTAAVSNQINQYLSPWIFGAEKGRPEQWVEVEQLRRFILQLPLVESVSGVELTGGRKVHGTGRHYPSSPKNVLVPGTLKINSNKADIK